MLISRINFISSQMPKKGKRDGRSIEPTGNPILEINYTDPLFSVAAHPTEPIFATGFATGHVYCNRYDAEHLHEMMIEYKEKDKKQTKKAVKAENTTWWTKIDDVNNTEDIVTSWKTKRHKGSCRLILFDPLESSVGKHLFTVGKENVIKKATTETGKVVTKTDISKDLSKRDAVTKLCHSTTHPFLLTGTEDGHVLVYDSNNLSNKFKVEGVHEDAVNHIIAMPGKSAYHYLSVGSTTLTHIDIRKGIVTQSDDQEDELLSLSFVPDDELNDTVLVSHGAGIVTIWKNSKNRLMDQLSRIKVNTDASVDVLMSAMDAEDDDLAASVWCGDSDGLVHRVNYKKGKVVEARLHAKNEEVGFLDIDYEYRLLSAGMDSLKLWLQGDDPEVSEDDNDSEESDSGDDSDDSDDSDDLEASDDESQISDEDDEENEDENLVSDEKEEDEVKAKILSTEEGKGDEDINEMQSEKPKKRTVASKDTPKKKQKAAQSKLGHSHGIRKFEGL